MINAKEEIQLRIRILHEELDILSEQLDEGAHCSVMVKTAEDLEIRISHLTWWLSQLLVREEG